jgi:hypothetical protein
MCSIRNSLSEERTMRQSLRRKSVSDRRASRSGPEVAYCDPVVALEVARWMHSQADGLVELAEQTNRIGPGRFKDFWRD